jgi:DNA-binding transcriptional LysR family regulator
VLDLSHVRCFVTAATELHFGRAAQRLNMTQPPLSRQIQLLEQELGVPLFVRGHRRVELTPAGRAFLSEARDLLQQSEAAAQTARRAAQANAGAITIGFVGASTYGFLPRLVASLSAELPDLEVTFRELSSKAQLEALAVNGIDLGLIRPVPVSAAYGSACVHRDSLALALPLQHPLAGRRRPDLAQIDGEPFIMYSLEGGYLHEIISSALARASVRPRIVQQMSHTQAILSLVSTGMGLAIVPEETKNACFDNVVFRPVALGNGVAVELHAVWRRDSRNPALTALRALLERMS